jgi:hypothetical protein
MNLYDELIKRKVRPFELSEAEYERDYADIYPVADVAMCAGDAKTRLALEAAIWMFQLRQSGYEES